MPQPPWTRPDAGTGVLYVAGWRAANHSCWSVPRAGHPHTSGLCKVPTRMPPRADGQQGAPSGPRLGDADHVLAAWFTDSCDSSYDGSSDSSDCAGGVMFSCACEAAKHCRSARLALFIC